MQWVNGNMMTVDIFWTLYSVYKNIIFPYLLDD